MSFCSPMTSYWDLLAPESDCNNDGPPLVSQAAITVLTDVITYLLPMPVLYNLKLPLAQRIGLMVLFGLGGIVIVASIMRTYWVVRLYP